MLKTRTGIPRSFVFFRLICAYEKNGLLLLAKNLFPCHFPFDLSLKGYWHQIWIMIGSEYLLSVRHDKKRIKCIMERSRFSVLERICYRLCHASCFSHSQDFDHGQKPNKPCTCSQRTSVDPICWVFSSRPKFCVWNGKSIPSQSHVPERSFCFTLLLIHSSYDDSFLWATVFRVWLGKTSASAQKQVRAVETLLGCMITMNQRKPALHTGFVSANSLLADAKAIPNSETIYYFSVWYWMMRKWSVLMILKG